MARKQPKSKLVDPPGLLQQGLTCSPTTWSYCDMFRLHLPKVIIAVGALFLVIGIIITVLSHSENVDYEGGYTAGSVLMVLGTVMVVGGILWLMFRKAYCDSYTTQNKGHENPGYKHNEGAIEGYGRASAVVSPKGGSPMNLDQTAAAPEDVKIVIGYVPTQKEDWQIGDIYQPKVIL